MIEVNNLTKNYGGNRVVNNARFSVPSGQVTGFLGPNGAGKSTTMRMILGLDRPTSGDATINGRKYHELHAPIREVGALLDAKGVHTSRSARNHLLTVAATHSIPASRVNEVLELTGLQSVAKRRAGNFSLGMGQRLGIATALLGDPHTLVLDEPVNGLDPEGVRWVRRLVRGLAEQGKTVLLSSHLMSEMEQTADRLVIIGRGEIMAEESLDEFVRKYGSDSVRIGTESPEALANLIAADGASITSVDQNRLTVTGVDSRQIAQTALKNNILIYELVPQHSSLEDAYMALTEGAVQYRTGAVAGR